MREMLDMSKTELQIAAVVQAASGDFPVFTWSEKDWGKHGRVAHGLLARKDGTPLGVVRVYDQPSSANYWARIWVRTYVPRKKVRSYDFNVWDYPAIL